MELIVRLGGEDAKALGVPQEMTIDPVRLRLSEARLLPSAGYPRLEDFVAELDDGELAAQFVLVWLACRRNGYTGAYADLDLYIADTSLTPAGGDGPGEADTPPGGDSTPS